MKMIQTESSDVFRELIRGDIKGKLGWIVSRWIWTVLVCLKMLLWIAINGD